MPNSDGNAAGVHVMAEVREHRVGVSGFFEAWRRMRGHVAFAVLAIVIVFWWLTMVALGTPHDWAFDFRPFWQAGSDVLDGGSPYPTSEMLDAARTTFDPVHVQEDYRFAYPAGAAVALVPFGALGFDVAAAVWGVV